MNTSQLALILARNDFSTFKKLVWKRYQHAKHLAYIDNYIKQCFKYILTEGKEGINRLIIEMPPRHGKSQNISRLLPGYFLGKFPDKRVLLTSYGASLSEGHSRWIRTLIQTPNYKLIFPETQLAQDSKARAKWDIKDHLGGLEAMGKGGSIVGKGGDLIVIDDIVKNRKEAESSLQRDNDYEWFINDLTTRLEPNGVIISIVTRWHEDDLHGRLRRLQPNTWTIVKLPAIAEDNDPLDRPVGTALWPSRYSINVLKNIQATSHDYSFNSLYQQNPMSKEGSLFKTSKIKLIDSSQIGTLAKTVMFFDLALSENESADYTVGLKLGETIEGTLVILNVTRVQIEYDELTQYLESVILRNRNKIRYGIEANFFHSKVVKKLLLKPALKGYTIQGIKTTEDKYTRALPIASRIGESLVCCLNEAWQPDLFYELASFPNGKHDDQVDSLSGAYNMLAVSDRKAVYRPYKGSTNEAN